MLNLDYTHNAFFHNALTDPCMVGLISDASATLQFVHGSRQASARVGGGGEQGTTIADRPPRGSAAPDIEPHRLAIQNKQIYFPFVWSHLSFH
jgi:hypothetical protein